ncbi:SDR family oxidoreductase [Parachryseolinea silvisoli]|uniref:SDR family oxidoreductase n=1 Tax=Parachryseolinea silvisoli TaxID=2873601 RepID=UPI002265B6BB|nr:SDR family oxidoreductase [Parachryseolinea silvisoli]MCD9016927.1 SDR family oxidoreductase [Parachryseolinea silvisoli]
MNLDLNGKRALVCGSTQGIGKASAIELALLGASITLVSRDEAKLQAVVRELQVYSGQQHDYIVADFSQPNKLQEKVQAYVATQTVHILINNTGGPPAGPALDATPDDFVRAFSAHLLCNHLLTQAVVPGMRRDGYGRIINIISTSVKIPIKGLGVSNTTRGAVANWAKTLSVELAPFGITVNNVLPGATMTGRLEGLIQSKAQKSGKSFEEAKQEMMAEIPAGRISEPHEVAAAVAFLASPAAGYINGINVPVDGGRTGSL